MSRWVRSAAVLLSLAAVAACSGDSDGGGGDAASALPPASAPAPTSTATAAPAASPADQVTAAYLRYWDAVVAAHRAADPRAPALATAAADPLLAKIRASVDRNRLQKLSLRGAVTHTVGAVRVTGGTATVEDCYDLSKWNPVNLTTGDPIDVTEEGGTGRYKARFTLRRSGGGWVVTTDAPLGGC